MYYIVLYRKVWPLLYYTILYYAIHIIFQNLCGPIQEPLEMADEFVSLLYAFISRIQFSANGRRVYQFVSLIASLCYVFCCIFSLC